MSLCTVLLTCEPAFHARCSCENGDFKCKYTLTGRGWDSPGRHIPVSLCPNWQRSSACTWTRTCFLLHHSGWRGAVVHLPISCRTPKWKVNEVYHVRAETRSPEMLFIQSWSRRPAQTLDLRAQIWRMKLLKTQTLLQESRSVCRFDPGNSWTVLFFQEKRFLRSPVRLKQPHAVMFVSECVCLFTCLVFLLSFFFFI